MISNDLHIRWFYDGSLNVSSNCLDRHLEARGNQIAIIWEGDDPNDTKKLPIENYMRRFVSSLML